MESQSKTASDALKMIREQLLNISVEDVITPLLDVVIMYCKKDMEFIPEAVATIPEYSRLILVETIESEETDWHIHVTNMQNNLIEATLNYPKNSFRFEFARNYINTLCECEWILHLDADERLLTHQHNLLFTMLKNLGSDYWGVNTGIYNVYNFKANDGFRKKTFENVTKIFRNNGLIKYEYPIHESVCNSIYANNKKIYDSNICLHHVGYEITIEKLIEKFERNIQLIWQYSHLSNNPIFQSYLEKSFISINQLRNYNNG